MTHYQIIREILEIKAELNAGLPADEAYESECRLAELDYALEWLP